MYLTRAPSILFSTLKHTWNYAVKGQAERQFIHKRLILFDRQYCLELDLQLQRFYWELGRQQQTWPVTLSALVGCLMERMTLFCF